MKIKNEIRVSLYLLLGVVPSSIGTLFSVFFGGYPALLLASLGTTGLAMATFKNFPLSRTTYWWTAVLLACGLVFASILMGLTVSLAWERQTLTESTAFVMAFCVGPTACAIHALVFGRTRSVQSNTTPSTTSA